MESLGGVFIATLFGLVLAMITLGFEVVYYRKKKSKIEMKKKKDEKKDRKRNENIVREKIPNIKFITVDPKTIDFGGELNKNFNQKDIILYPKARKGLPLVN